MRALRIENEQLRQRLERMERRVRGVGDISPAASPRPLVSSAATTKTATSTPPVAPLVLETSVQGGKRSRKRSAEVVSDRNRAQPPTKMIKLETEAESSLSHRLHRYAASSSDFPLDNLTDEIFTESDESFTTATPYRSVIAEDERPLNGAAAAEGRLGDKSSCEPSTFGKSQKGHKEEEEEDGNDSVAASRPSSHKKLSQKLYSAGEKGGLVGTAKLPRKGGRRSVGRPPSRPSITISLQGTRYPYNV
jgi:hypothetical protein